MQEKVESQLTRRKNFFILIMNGSGTRLVTWTILRVLGLLYSVELSVASRYVSCSILDRFMSSFAHLPSTFIWTSSGALIKPIVVTKEHERAR